LALQVNILRRVNDEARTKDGTASNGDEVN